MKKDIEHARMMFSMAYKDLKAMNGMKDEEIFDDEIFGFHAQQSASPIMILASLTSKLNLISNSRSIEMTRRIGRMLKI